MFYRKFSSAIAFFILACFMTACSVTTAPTDASSGTSGQSTDASSDLTSSTTLDDDDDDKDDSEGDSEEEEIKQEEKEVEEFVTANFSQLRADMSVGRGEYLTTLATLMSVNEGDKDRFYAITKNNFSSIFVSSQTTAKELIVNLKQEVAQANI